MEEYNYYQVQGWMVKNLKLKGNELICYAVIYSFSQDEESKFMGGIKYLCDWINASEPTVVSILDKLVEKGLIERFTAITKTCKRVYYQVTKDSLVRGNLRNLSKGTKDSLGSLYNNNNNNIDNNNKKRLSNDNQKKVFVKPTIEQVEAYITEKGYHFDAEQFWNHYESVGWMIGKNHMKDWHCACATWEGRRKQDIREKKEKEENIPLTEDIAMRWDAFQKWAAINIQTVAGIVTCQDFKDMMSLVHNKSDIIADILKEIENSFYDGMDIMTEFNFCCQMDRFSKRIKDDDI